MTVHHNTTNEWVLWVVALSCALHAAEEYFTGWQQWALETLAIAMPASWFLVANALLVLAAVSLAGIGWRRPTLSLIIPAATLSNAIFFHILPTVMQGRRSPGVYTATLLYMPFSTWALLGAWRDGVGKRAIGMAVVAGSLQMMAVVVAARWMSSVNRVG
ncbi:MAG TPA: HXXEE domain-containing protein [Blastocatellia bacterium]|nr:HXXEE domain-containing protein [Blastocatellia bacterium]